MRRLVTIDGVGKENGRTHTNADRDNSLEHRRSSLAQHDHVTICGPAQSKGKPELDRFKNALMIFSNRFACLPALSPVRAGDRAKLIDYGNAMT
jgi:hypothetical protein